MPVEIRELVIRAIVNPAADAGAQRAALDDAPGGRRQSGQACPESEVTPAMIEACVRQVLRLLDQREER